MAKNFSSPGLTCFIEFPKPGNSSPSEFPIITNDIESKGNEKTVVIVLLGWAGAKDKPLSKYSDVYVKNGCITVRCSVPFGSSFSDHSKLAVAAARVVEILKDNEFYHHPMFFHVFSNGGAFFYTECIREIARQRLETTFDFPGTIFDSAPLPQSCQLGYRAAKEVFKSMPVPGLGYILAWIAYAYLLLSAFVYFNLLAWEFCTEGARFVGLPPRNNCLLITTHWLERICNLRNHAFLFLYSDADAISPSEKIELVAGHLQGRGNIVSLVKFEGSGHVLHFRKYHKEYMSDVSKFIQETLRSYGRPTTFWDETY